MQETDKNLDHLKRVEDGLERLHLLWLIAAFAIVAIFALPHIHELWPTTPASAQTDSS